MVSLAYPIDRLDGHCSVLQYCSIIGFLYWKSLRIGPYFAPQLPWGFDHFCGTVRGTTPSPHCGAGRPSLQDSTICGVLLWTYLSKRGFASWNRLCTAIVIIYSHKFVIHMNAKILRRLALHIEKFLLIRYLHLQKLTRMETLITWIFHLWDESNSYDWMDSIR